MTTIRFTSLAALLVAPILAMAEPARDDAAREQAASTRACECQAKKQAKTNATVESAEWIQRMTTTME